MYFNDGKFSKIIKLYSFFKCFLFTHDFKNFQILWPGATLIRGDLLDRARLGRVFDDHAFDAVIAPNSLQYSQDRVATLRELKRVTAPDGSIVVGLFSAPNKVQYSAVMGAVRDT